jgi:cell fate (sporulation/competence/biofilm development) regulator YmcA (YheA/YmcA/DUF963 family)
MSKEVKRKVKELKEKIKLDPFHYHEAIDRTHMIGCIIEDNLLNHPVIQKHKKVKKKVNKVLKLFGEIYQNLGYIDAKRDGVFEDLKNE